MNLLNMGCKNSKDIEKLSNEQINQYLKEYLPQWVYRNDSISHKFEFKNFKQTMFFVNAVAYVCESEIHHPDMKIGFNYCEIEFSTHDIGGISLNDIICAYKVSNLIKGF